jgi:CheY-like chemotaxis protein
MAQSGDDAGLGRPKRGSSVAQLTVEQLEKMIAGAVSLAAAASKDATAPVSFEDVGSAVQNAAGKILAGFKASEAASGEAQDDWRSRVLWVDDRPQNNTYERKAMESMGIQFTLAETTDEALRILSTQRFAAIISDMGRREGPREGYKLLEAIRAKDATTPFFIYAGSRAPQHRQEAALRGAQGTTNRVDELVDMVTRSLQTGSEPSGASTSRAEIGR